MIKNIIGLAITVLVLAAVPVAAQYTSTGSITQNIFPFGTIGINNVDSPGKSSSLQVCASACDHYYMIVNVAGTAGATASGWALLFDQASPTCPANGALSGATLAKPGLALDTDGTRGSLSIKYDNGQQRHYTNGLLVCWSTGADEFTMALGGAVMSVHAGVK